MSKPITLPWNAARYRQDSYAPRVTHVHGPVGEYVWDGDVPTHRCCGYHVCSCEPEDESTKRARRRATAMGLDFDHPEFQKAYKSVIEDAWQPTLNPGEYKAFLSGNPFMRDV